MRARSRVQFRGGSGMIARAMTRTFPAVSAICLFALLGCRATRNLDDNPAGAGPNKLLDKTAVGKNRCEGGGGNYSPFVVEWDATDLSSFEAKASRDLVFVRYADCQIEMLYGCSDSGIPGKYGRYAEPTFTSGTVEGFTMKNEDELYAKLPLGAAQFAGNVKIGETLALKYFVSGSVQATRDDVYRTSLKDNPRCQQATHFVSAFNLGAFRLEAYKGQKGEVKVGLQEAGGGAKTTSESDNLKEAGKLDSCETQAQRQCRVPIRLVLNPIAEGEAPQASPVATTAIQTAPAQPYEDTPSARAYKLRTAAGEKEGAGDGVGCLADIERARGLDDSDQSRRSTMYLEAQCMMRAGRCDEGKALMRDFLKSIDDKRKKTDAEIERSVSAEAKLKCPVSMQADVESKMHNIYAQISQAQEKSDWSTCAQLAKDSEALLKQVDKKDVQKRNTVTGGMMMAANCLATLERCDEAKKLWLRYYDLTWPDMKPADRKSTAEQTFSTMPACKGK
jgi:hypothetical protein